MNYLVCFFNWTRILLLFPLLCACNKFLDEKPSKSAVIPYSLEDLQALMDAGNRINFGMYCPLLEAGTDNFYLDESGFDALTPFEQDIYTWQKEPIYSIQETGYIWGDAYLPVGIANTVLDELKEIREYAGLNPEEIRGAALFHRGFSHFMIAQVYSENFRPGANNNSLGIPLRLTSDISVKSTRSTLGETYTSILSDLTTAAELLPRTSAYQTRPNKVSAYAALARVYLSMHDYENAGKYAHLVLQEDGTLFSFSDDIDVDATFPFEAMNKETLFFAYAGGLFMTNTLRAKIDPGLYQSFHDNDLRKKAFFQENGDGSHAFKGGYMGFGYGAFFVGMTTPEMYLIKAECLARSGQAEEAISVLNNLLSTRWAPDTFSEYNAQTADDALAVILEERRKELIMRGTRWSDLKRLNRDERFAKTLVRELAGIRYELPAGDNRYQYPIPREVIALTGMQQNPR